MSPEELIAKADFAKHAKAHKDALREALFGKKRTRPKVRELSIDDLEEVTAASKSWIEREKKFPHD